MAVLTAFIFAVQMEDLQHQHDREVAGFKMQIAHYKKVNDALNFNVKHCASYRLPNGQYTTEIPVK
jgi:hypothetical protein